MLRSCIIALALLLPASLRAQEWEPIGAESFSAIAGAEDGSLLLIRYPGDILRSTDTGGTWQVVCRAGFRVQGTDCNGNALTGCAGQGLGYRVQGMAAGN